MAGEAAGLAEQRHFARVELAVETERAVIVV